MATESSRSVVCHKKCLMYVEFSLSFLSLLSQQKCFHCQVVATKFYKTKTPCLGLTIWAALKCLLWLAHFLYANPHSADM